MSTFRLTNIMFAYPEGMSWVQISPAIYKAINFAMKNHTIYFYEWSNKIACEVEFYLTFQLMFSQLSNFDKMLMQISVRVDHQFS